MSVMALKLKFEDGKVTPLSKDEEFALALRIAGYVGDDRQFSDLACFTRMAIRLGIVKDTLPFRAVISIWGDML